MVHDFKSAALVLALKPPIMVRKGMLMLRRVNCQVLYQSAPPPPKAVVAPLFDRQPQGGMGTLGVQYQPSRALAHPAQT